MINSTNRTNSVANIGGIPVPLPKTAPRTPEETDRFSTESLNRLRQALDQQPSVRPDVVELGRSLASNPSYPSEPIVKKLAELLVASGESDGDGSD